MDARHFTYTTPSSIEGEPAEVVEITKQQIREVAVVVAELSRDTFVQLRAAGIAPDDENAVEAWLASEEGAQARDLVYAAKHLVEASKAL